MNVFQFRSVTTHASQTLKCSDALSMNISNELPGFAKYFCAIVLLNEMLVGLAHYIAFKCTKYRTHLKLRLLPFCEKFVVEVYLSPI